MCFRSKKKPIQDAKITLYTLRTQHHENNTSANSTCTCYTKSGGAPPPSWVEDLGGRYKFLAHSFWSFIIILIIINIISSFLHKQGVIYIQPRKSTFFKGLNAFSSKETSTIFPCNYRSVAHMGSALIGSWVAWNSSNCFESFSPLNNVWIDRPLMLSSDVTHYPKTG